MLKTYDLNSFFSSINYDYREDLEKIKTILSLTKTRLSKDISFKEKLYRNYLKIRKRSHPRFSEIDTNFSPTFGMEQTFLLKALTDYLNPSNVFEIGTGRGTGSYSISLSKSVEKIVTVDLIPFTTKAFTSVNSRPAYVSNKDIYDLIPYISKNKIQFVDTTDYGDVISKYESFFDVCFIDGYHDSSEIISQDFGITLSMIKDDGYIIWDDYNPKRYKVKQVVDQIIDKYAFESTLIEFRGHLFGDAKLEKGSGIVLMKISLNDTIRKEIKNFKEIFLSSTKVVPFSL